METTTTTNNKGASLGSLPQDCRRNILYYISHTELYACFAATSRFCHADSLDDQLPQTKWGAFHITGRGETEINMESLLQRISHPSSLYAWQSPRSHMTIVSHERYGAVVTGKADDLTLEEMQEQASLLSFGSITSLDLSVSHPKGLLLTFPP